MSTLNVKIITAADQKPAQFRFVTDKFNWESLNTIIDSSPTPSMEPPITLFYKLQNDNGDVQSLESQADIDTLLAAASSVENNNHVIGLRLFTDKDAVSQTVFIIDPFYRLGDLVSNNKQAVHEQPRLARLVGFLATFISLDTKGHDFEHEFSVLEALIQKHASKQEGHPEEEGEDCLDVSANDNDGHYGGASRPEFFARGWGGRRFSPFDAEGMDGFGRHGGRHHGGHHYCSPFDGSHPHHGGKHGRGGRHHGGRHHGGPSFEGGENTFGPFGGRHGQHQNPFSGAEHAFGASSPYASPFAGGNDQDNGRGDGGFFGGCRGGRGGGRGGRHSFGGRGGFFGGRGGRGGFGGGFGGHPGFFGGPFEMPNNENSETEDTSSSSSENEKEKCKKDFKRRSGHHGRKFGHRHHHGGHHEEMTMKMLKKKFMKSMMLGNGQGASSSSPKTENHYHFGSVSGQ